jgi:AAA+ ATPase superfamily predicted ATPase
MYFDIEVKEKKEDFYGHEKEYLMLKSAVNEGRKLIVIKGVRRVGKSSLMRVIYREFGSPAVWVDGRIARQNWQDLLEQTMRELWRQLDIKNAAITVLSSVSIGPITITKDKQTKALEKISEELNNELKGRKLMARIFIDEAQLIKDLAAPIAYIYDHMSNIQFILSGSEVGVLEKFVGSESDAPLFGRLKEEIKVDRMQPESAREYLKTGSLQSGKEIPEYEINDTITQLDGLIGWLTYYGYLRRNHGHKEALAVLINDAQSIVRAELDEFLRCVKGNKKRYIQILKIVATGPKSWAEIKKGVELYERKTISSGRINDYLAALSDYSFIVKNQEQYTLADPIMHLVCRKY